MTIYGRPDPTVNAADAYMQRAEAIERRRCELVDERERELTAAIKARPLQAVIRSVYAFDPMPTIGAEFVAWVMQTYGDPERAMAEAIWQPETRDRMVASWVAHRAERDAADTLAKAGLA
jgi:hypothetical protein